MAFFLPVLEVAAAEVFGAEAITLAGDAIYGLIEGEMTFGSIFEAAPTIARGVRSISQNIQYARSAWDMLESGIGSIQKLNSADPHLTAQHINTEQHHRRIDRTLRHTIPRAAVTAGTVLPDVSNAVSHMASGFNQIGTIEQPHYMSELDGMSYITSLKQQPMVQDAVSSIAQFEKDYGNTPKESVIQQVVQQLPSSTVSAPSWATFKQGHR